MQNLMIHVQRGCTIFPDFLFYSDVLVFSGLKIVYIFYYQNIIGQGCIDLYTLRSERSNHLSAEPTSYTFT